MSIEEERRKYQPHIPNALKSVRSVEINEGESTASVADAEEIKKHFPGLFGKPVISIRGLGSLAPNRGSLVVGVVFSGGQAAGGHNVVAGLYDAIKEIDSHNRLIGFLGGPSGVIENRYKELTNDEIDRVRNMGGFDLIGSGRTKIETEEQLAAALETLRKHELNGLLIIGGDDSNTNAAVLAEYCIQNDCYTQIVGVPKTIDGDLKNEHVEISFGFDTACKCYSEMISNIERDALSARKYYHFIKLMGRSASHIALECALQTHPNYTIIGEEVQHHGWSFDHIISDIAEMIVKRAEMDHHFGVVLIPEGVIEFIPEMKQLIVELNQIIAKNQEDPVAQLSQEAKKTFESIPKNIQEQLIMDRDPHGNVQVSHIATEKLIVEALKKKLKSIPEYKGKFNPVEHFFGYEGRAAYPSNFDANYCYALGRVSAVLMNREYTGYMGVIKGLCKKSGEWEAYGIPLTSMMNMEVRKGKSVPVIRKFLVDLSGAPFKTFKANREEWKYEPCYQYVGPIQYFGPADVVNALPQTLQLES